MPARTRAARSSTCVAPTASPWSTSNRPRDPMDRAAT
jgi:hypothetical protein